MSALVRVSIAACRFPHAG